MGNLDTGQSAISVSFYNSLVGGDVVPSASQDDMNAQVANALMGNRRGSIGMSDASSYGSIDRFVSQDPRKPAEPQGEEHLTNLTRRLADMFQQKQELTEALRSERARNEELVAERDELQGLLNARENDLADARAQIEQGKAARDRASKFMDEARTSTMKIIGESRMKVSAAEQAREEAEKAYQEELVMRRSMEQLVQESQAQCNTMERNVTQMRADLDLATQQRDEASSRAAEAERALLTVKNESTAHASRIQHLTERNELLARNLQTVTGERDDIRRQFDETATNHATLSADYESMRRRCEAAEAERDRIRAEATEASAESERKVAEMEDEARRALSVLSLVRPIIDKANSGALRTSDVSLLNERMLEYERLAGDVSEELPSVAQYMPAAATRPAPQPEPAAQAPQPEPRDAYGAPEAYGGMPAEADIEVDAGEFEDFDPYSDDYLELFEAAMRDDAADGTGSILEGIGWDDADGDGIGDATDEDDIVVDPEPVSFTGMFGGIGGVQDSFDDLDEPDGVADEAADGDGDGIEELSNEDLLALGIDPDMDGIDMDGFDSDADALGMTGDEIDELLAQGEELEDQASLDDIKRINTTEDIEAAAELGIDLSEFNAIMAGFAHYDDGFAD